MFSEGFYLSYYKGGVRYNKLSLIENFCHLKSIIGRISAFFSIRQKSCIGKGPRTNHYGSQQS